MLDEQVEHSENVCVADADDMDVEDIVVDFEKEAEPVFKIPVKRKKKSCGKARKMMVVVRMWDQTVMEIPLIQIYLSVQICLVLKMKT